jgi:4-amino-4-deoxy-L-arabinose transferase-like glycosyltransferase
LLPESTESSAEGSSVLGYAHAPPPAGPLSFAKANDPLIRWDILLLIGFCTLLFGYVAISGRPMTLHEARLPECCREMLARGNWLIPFSGSRPWLERPPFPHWVEMSVSVLLGQHCDTEWAARIPASLMGIGIVLMVGWMAAGWFGRNIGIVSGLMLATMYEFYYYSTLSEDDIFLGFLVVGAIALFIRMEFFVDPDLKDSRVGFFGGRPLSVLLFFFLLGLTNLAKGPIVGAAVVVGTLAIYLLWRRDWRRAKRYCWLWGWLLAGIVALSWHLYIWKKYPEYRENLRYDFSDTSEFDEPFWYYPPQLLSRIMPWTPVAIVGIWMLARSAWRERNAIAQFLWCWAIVPIVVLSIPHRKHHHYLVPSIAPWAILAALGARSIAVNIKRIPDIIRRPAFGVIFFGIPGAAAMLILHKRIPGPSWALGLLAITWLSCIWALFRGFHTRNPRWMLAAILIFVGFGYSWGQSVWPDDNVTDTAFLRQADAMVPQNKLLIVNGGIGPLDFFRTQFYLRDSAVLLHNLSFLRGDEIHDPDVYIIGRARDLPAISTLGTADIVTESVKSRRETNPLDRFTLFHLVFRADLRRYPTPAVSPMQAMLRKPGPYCGPPLD